MKKTLIAASILLPVIAYGLWFLMNARTYQVFGEIVPRVGVQSPVVALTFDDGPTPEYTDEVLAVLRERNVKATFFVTGRETDQNPAQAARIVADGHELGNHSYTHSRLVFKTPSTVRTEIERTDAAIRNAGYEGEILFRPPYGKKLLVLPWVLDQTGRRTITCDVEPESYEDIAGSAEAITAHVLENTRPGSIVLLHLMYASREQSREALPAIIDGLLSKGFEFRTVSALLRAGGV